MACIEIEELSEDAVRFKLSETSLAFANALRRVMMTEVPTIAIEMVEYDKNNTVLPEEMTADRLGLIPIDSRRAEDLKYPEECGCSGVCQRCAVEIELDVRSGAGEPRVVTSDDLVVEQGGPLVGDPAGPSVITKLGKNQSIKCRCVARKGVGATHIKWSPVTAIAFGYDEENRHRHTNYWHEQDVNKEWPLPWFASSEKSVVQHEDFLLGQEPSVFHFKVEVVRGCLEPLEVLRRGVRVLGEKLGVFISKVEEISGEALY